MTAQDLKFGKKSLIGSPCTPCLNSQYYHHNFFFFRKLIRKKNGRPNLTSHCQPQSRAQLSEGGPAGGFTCTPLDLNPGPFSSSQNLTFSLAHQLPHHRFLTTPCTCTISPHPLPPKVFYTFTFPSKVLPQTLIFLKILRIT